MALGEFAYFPPLISVASGIASINGASGPNILIVGGTGISVGTSGNTLTVTNLNPTATSSFVIMQTPAGTSPTATSPTDTLTWLSSSANLTITGNSGAKSITLGLSPSNLTDAGTDGITITGGTGAVLGSGTTISQHVADSTHNGYLLAADWSTFNSKQAAGNYITALTGDVTAAGPGSVAATLATVNGNVGSFTNASITVNAKGLITAASSGTAGVTTVGAFSASSQTNGASISGSTITFGPSDATNPGMVSTGAQTIAGIKTFTANHIILGSSHNIGIADSAIWGSLSSGTNNTALGASALNGLTTGSFNVAIGDNAMAGATVTGLDNVAIGDTCLNKLTSGSDNVAIGNAAMYNATVTGSENIAIGLIALAQLTSGGNNIAIGQNAGNHITSGQENIFIGDGSGTALTTGSSNVGLGAMSSDIITTGRYNIALGFGANHSANSVSNQLVIGGAGTDDSGQGSGGITAAYIGNGVTASSPKNIAINATGGSGTNIAGASMTLAGGISTGNAAGGPILFQTSPAGASSSTPNSLVTVGQITSTGAHTIGATSTTPTHVLNTNSTTGAGTGTFTNVPGGAGNPTGYIQITLNGVTSYIPYWQ